MQLSDFYFDLPSELIACEPLADRAASRLLILNKRSRSFRDSSFGDLPDLLRADDLLILNNTQVFPARLIGKTLSGAKIEIFLVKHVEKSVWQALAKPARRLQRGSLITFSKELSADVREKLPDGTVEVALNCSGDVDALIDAYGRTPLPPYIKRDAATPDLDRERYQTIFASRRGAIAAPTAGLHFTEGILNRIRERGIEIAEITLHVGYGTFEPVRSKDLAAHRVAPERFEIDSQAADKLERARKASRRIVAVGTTTTRTLEYALSRSGRFCSMSGNADLTITPGYRFRAVGAMLTNFHLPQSSLLILVSTFAGHELIMRSYDHAVEARYRFYSFGDCMFIQ